MAVEARPSHLQGPPDHPLSPFSQEAQESTQEELKEIVDEFLPKALDILDPYVSAWAGKDWKVKGLPVNGIFEKNKPKDFRPTYFGSVPQGGPAQFLVIRKESGEGILLQKANPEANSIAGKKYNYIYWTGERATRDKDLGAKFLEGLRKIDRATFPS